MNILMNLLNTISFDTFSLGYLALGVFFLWVCDYFSLFSKYKNKQAYQLHLHPVLNSYNAKDKLHRWMIFMVGVFIWMGIIFASMSPYTWSVREKHKDSKLDLYFVFDVSLSMLADDYFPNRLTAAKEKLVKIIKHLENTKMGLILFSEEIQTSSVLTKDVSFLLSQIYKIQVGPLGHGTNIGDALMLALSRLLGEDNNPKVKNRPKAVILITDGVAQIGLTHPLTAAKYYKKYGIKIYSIGMGASKFARLPNGQLIPGGSADMNLLKKMASLTNGASYSGKSTKQLFQALKEISLKEDIYFDPTDEKNKVKNYVMEFYFIFFILGLIGVEWYRKCYHRELL